MALGTEFIVKYLSDISGAKQGAKEVQDLNANIAKTMGKNYADATRVIGTSLEKLSSKKITFRGKEAIQETTQLGTAFQRADGTSANFIKTNVLLNGAVYKTSVEIEKNKNSVKGLAENLKFLGMRALTVMPIWAALRALMQATQRVFTEGFQDLVDESLLLQKVKNTLQGTTTEIATSLKRVADETQSLALESGVSQDKIIATFQKFSSVGLDVATAMAATNAAIKLSVITQGEATVSAEAFAHAFAVLIPTTATVGEKQKQINDIIALTSELWKTNGFNIEEFTGSLEKFAITSKSVNFTTSQTLALLATLSKSGLGSAGSLLRNSMGQLLVNMDKLAGSLGVKVNPALDDTFTVLMKVLEQLDKLQKVNDLRGLESAKEALKDVFGGTRSAVPIVALSSLYDALKKNISLTADVNTLNASFKDTESVLGNVVARFHTANSEIGEAFVNGLVGGENFNDSLEKIVSTLNKTISIAEKTGHAINTIWTITGPGPAPVFDQWNKNIDKTNKKILEFSDLLISGLRGKASNDELKKILTNLIDTRNELQRLDNKGIEKNANGTIQSQLQIIAKNEAIIRGNLNKPTATTEGVISDKQTKNAEQQALYAKDAQEVAKIVLNNSIERLKQEGALNSQILIATQLRSQQLGIEEKSIDKLSRKLEIERAINDEKRLQGKLSSDTIKLYDISKTSGIEVARQVGDVLAGNIDLDMFIRRGGEAADVFIKNFADVYKQKQAEQFFKGERVTGEQGLYGGTRIAIQEEALRKPVSQYDVNLALAKRAAEQQFQRLTNVTATVPVTINTTIDISKMSEVKKACVDEICKQAPYAGTAVNDALVQAFNGKQGKNL
jgi:hypothetical protein